MKSLVATTILVILAFVSVKAKPNPGWNLPNLGKIGDVGKEMMTMAKSALETFTSFKPGEVQEILLSLKNPKDREAFLNIIGMIVKGAPLEDVGDALLEADSGPTIAEKLMPLLMPVAELKDKYGPVLEQAKLKGK